MFRSTSLRIALLCLLTVPFVGCAEFDYRGGLVAKISDRWLFPAHTKSHRLLRAYSVFAGLMAVARNTGYPQIDKVGIAGNVHAVLDTFRDAYNCIYPGHAKPLTDEAIATIKKGDGNEIQTFDSKNKYFDFSNPGSDTKQSTSYCVFFDERMARIDYAIYKLAVVVLFDSESRQFFADVEQRLIGEVPVIGQGLRAATLTAQAINETAKATYQATDIVNGILHLSLRAAGPAYYLFPIYRDTLELDMHIILDALWSRCNFDLKYPPNLIDRVMHYPQDFPLIKSIDVADGPIGTERGAPSCKAVALGASVFHEGNGSLTEWRSFIRNVDGVSDLIEAYPAHFALVSRWLYKSCDDFFGKPDLVSQACAGRLEPTKVDAYGEIRTRDNKRLEARQPKPQPNMIGQPPAPRPGSATTGSDSALPR